MSITGGYFQDNSIIIYRGNDIVALILGHLVIDGEFKSFYSHNGTTFGGLVLNKTALSIKYLDQIFEVLEKYFIGNNINYVEFKQTSNIYSSLNTSLLDYYFYLNNYTQLSELGYHIDFSQYNDEVIDNYSKSRRRDYRYSLKNNFLFKELETKEEIADFYNILCDNYKKFNKIPIHTLDNFIDFRFDRLKDKVKFYGVYKDTELIAGGMVFLFNKQTFHTQYLAVKQDCTNLFSNEFLYTNLINQAKNLGFRYISFGTSTFKKGKVLNRPLAQFKEGFGTSCYINKTFIKHFNISEVDYD